MKIRHIMTIWQKEMLDTIRDRRTLFAMIIIPLILTPILTVGLPALMTRQQRAVRESISHIGVVEAPDEKSTELPDDETQDAAHTSNDAAVAPVVDKAQRTEPNSQHHNITQGTQGPGAIPTLIESLRDSAGIKVSKPSSRDAAFRALRRGDLNLIVELPQGFEQRLSKGEKPAVRLYYDSTKSGSEVAHSRFMAIFNSFIQKMAAIKLAERGVDPSILMPPQVTSENTAPKEKRGGLILAMILPTIITIWASIGGMYTAIDVAAGEKERGTLEPLIVTPPSRDSLVIGKFLAVLTVSAITVLLVVGGILVALRFGDLAGAMGDDKAEFVLPVARAIGIFLIGFLLASLTSAIEITLSIFARSFKEAQNYITPLYIAVMVPGVLSQISSAGGTSPAPWYFLIPVANAVEIFKELLLGTINWNHIGITAGSSLIYAILALMAAIRIFSREDVLFR